MSETSPSNIPRQDVVFSCLLYLEYAMAGDVESLELLEKLGKRRNEIPWNDPAFIAFSEQMQALPSPFDGDKNLMAEATAVVYATRQKNAELNETLSNAIPKWKQALVNYEKVNDYNAELFSYLHKMLEIHGRMRDQLELLSADVSPYTLPALPKVPNIDS